MKPLTHSHAAGGGGEDGNNIPSPLPGAEAWQQPRATTWLQTFLEQKASCEPGGQGRARAESGLSWDAEQPLQPWFVSGPRA